MESSGKVDQQQDAKHLTAALLQSSASRSELAEFEANCFPVGAHQRQAMLNLNMAAFGGEDKQA